MLEGPGLRTSGVVARCELYTVVKRSLSGIEQNGRFL